MAQRFYITTPIYYVNDRPHIGHAYTTVAADVLARYHRQKGHDVFFLTGTDEHGAKVAESAQKAGMEPQAFCDQNSLLFKDAFKALDISHDYFIRTTDKRHLRAVQKFMQLLHDRGHIYEGVYEGLYCVGCEKFLTEKELVDGKCPLHNRPPEKLKEKNYFFKLKKYLPAIQRLVEQGKLGILPAERKNEVLGLFKQDLEDFSVSREKVTWGIPLPFDPKQKTYVWVEALQNYISAVGYGDDEKEFKQWWPADAHLMAKDILKFHAIYWPAMLMAAGVELPKKIFAHGFFSIDGKKMSKSLGNVIDPNDLVSTFGVDAARYLLLTQFPFGQDGDIKESLFAEKYNADLANNLGNLVSRVLNMIEQYLDGKVEQGAPALVPVEHLGEHIERFEFDFVLKELWAAIAKANQYIDEHAPWQLAKDPAKRGELEKVLGTLASFLLECAGVLEPFMPHTADTIVGGLELPRITKGDPLFKRK